MFIYQNIANDSIKYNIRWYLSKSFINIYTGNGISQTMKIKSLVAMLKEFIININSCTSKYAIKGIKYWTIERYLFIYAHQNESFANLDKSFRLSTINYHKSLIKCEQKKRRICLKVNDLEHLEWFKQSKWLRKTRETEIDSIAQK